MSDDIMEQLNEQIDIYGVPNLAGLFCQRIAEGCQNGFCTMDDGSCPLKGTKKCEEMTWQDWYEHFNVERRLNADAE